MNDQHRWWELTHPRLFCFAEYTSQRWYWFGNKVVCLSCDTTLAVQPRSRDDLAPSSQPVPAGLSASQILGEYRTPSVVFDEEQQLWLPLTTT